jgi:hypothetical protein
VRVSKCALAARDLRYAERSTTLWPHQFHETAIGRCGRKLQSLKFGMRRPAPATGMAKCQIEVVSLAYR